MKIKINFIFSLIFSFICLNVKSQKSIVSSDFSPNEHPRLLLFKNEEHQLLKDIKSDKLKKKIHNTIILKSNEILNLPPISRVLIGFRLLDQSREFLKRIFYLSYSYRITHKEKYALRAQIEMLTVATFPDWNASRHFLDVGEMTTGMAIGYDWLYDFLKPEYRNIIANAIISYGLLPSLDEKNNSWLSQETNWNQVCNTGMLLGAISVYETNPLLSNKIINRSIESIRLPMRQYAPDGGYPEGYAYWDYGTFYNVLFMSTLDKVFQNDFGLYQSPGFLKTGDYYLNMLGPFGFCFNYSDCFTDFPEKSISPAIFWLANKTNNKYLLFNQVKIIKDAASGIINDERFLPASLIWSLKMSFDSIPKPISNVWEGKGKTPVALMRSDWNGKNSLFVGFKGGSPSVSHSHMDIGSFVFDANGERWSMDFPMQNYNDLEINKINLWDLSQQSDRWKLFRYNNLAHNTLSFDGELQQVNGFAPIKITSTDSNLLSSSCDLSNIYKNKVKSVIREISIVDKKYLSTKDEVETSNKDVILRWSMVTSANVKILNHDKALLFQNGKKIEFKVIAPFEINVKTWPTKPINNFEAQNDGFTIIGFEIKLLKKSKSTIFVNLVPFQDN